jgi:hypothetical protein
MIKKCFVLVGIFMMLTISASFAETQKSRLELDYGTAYKLQKFNQVLNPDAEKNLEPVYGLDGSAAGEVVNQYRKAFKEPGKTQEFEIGAGGK